MRLNKYLSIWTVFVVIIGLAVLSLPFTSMAVSGVYSPKPDNSQLRYSQPYDRSNIQLFLESKINDDELLSKVKSKLIVLSDEEISLISSLCERISHDSKSAGSEVAFLLITTLIILS